MSKHNTDIAACANDKCGVKEKCLRWKLGTNKDPHQVYLMTDSCRMIKCEAFLKL